MTAGIIITFCVLLLIAYLFDLSFSKTNIPSVILLLVLGFAGRRLAEYFEVGLPDFTPVLPVLGTFGLVLIVLEGSLELELNASKIGVIKKSLIGVIVSMLATAFVIAALFHYIGENPWKQSLINAIPFCVISSAIAIPSVKNLTKTTKEFIVYESSLSDIIGVLFFNFIVSHKTYGLATFATFSLQLVLMIAVSFAATLLLSYLLGKISHHIKFVPIILLVMLIYEVSKVYELPSLIFIMLFGLFMGNLDELRKFRIVRALKPLELNEEAQRFKGLAFEAAFLIRSLFFILFGYLIQSNEVLNTSTLLWSFGIVFVIFAFRAIQLKWSGLPMRTLLFVAPRGLITILLFISIIPENSIPLVNKSIVIQVILISVLVMMISIMTSSKKVMQEDEVQAAEAVAPDDTDEEETKKAVVPG